MDIAYTNDSAAIAAALADDGAPRPTRPSALSVFAEIPLDAASDRHSVALSLTTLDNLSVRDVTRLARTSIKNYQRSHDALKAFERIRHLINDIAAATQDAAVRYEAAKWSTDRDNCDRDAMAANASPLAQFLNAIALQLPIRRAFFFRSLSVDALDLNGNTPIRSGDRNDRETFPYFRWQQDLPSPNYDPRLKLATEVGSFWYTCLNETLNQLVAGPQGSDRDTALRDCIIAVAMMPGLRLMSEGPKSALRHMEELLPVAFWGDVIDHVVRTKAAPASLYESIDQYTMALLDAAPGTGLSRPSTGALVEIIFKQLTANPKDPVRSQCISRFSLAETWVRDILEPRIAERLVETALSVNAKRAYYPEAFKSSAPGTALKHWIVAWNTPDPLFLRGIHNRLFDHFSSVVPRRLLNSAGLEKPLRHAFFCMPPEEMFEMTHHADILVFWRVYLDAKASNDVFDIHHAFKKMLGLPWQLQPTLACRLFTTHRRRKRRGPDGLLTPLVESSVQWLNAIVPQCLAFNRPELAARAVAASLKAQAFVYDARDDFAAQTSRLIPAAMAAITKIPSYSYQPLLDECVALSQYGPMEISQLPEFSSFSNTVFNAFVTNPDAHVVLSTDETMTALTIGIGNMWDQMPESTSGSASPLEDCIARFGLAQGENADALLDAIKRNAAVRLATGRLLPSHPALLAWLGEAGKRSLLESVRPLQSETPQETRGM